MAHVQSFDDRFDVLAGLAYRVAYRLTGDRHVSEELAQEALARAYERWRKIAAYDEAWTARVTTNLAIGRWRRRTDVEQRLEAGAAADSGLAERLDLLHALRRLPRRQRAVVVLRYLGDLSEAQVANQLGCSTGAVKQHAHRGLNALRSSIGPPDRGPGPLFRTDETEEKSNVRTPR